MKNNKGGKRVNKEIVLITGGNGNIAQAIIQKYLSRGSKVIGLDLAKETTNQKWKENPNYQYYQVDVTNIEQIKKVYDKIGKTENRMTHLISAAGCPMKTELEGIESATFEDIDKSIKVNLTSHIYLTKIFLPLIEKEKLENRTITLISSINALRTFNLPVYSAAKAGIYGFMNAMVKELGKKNIRINVVSPGTVPTPEDFASGTEFYNYRYKSMLALKEFTKPEDIADSIYSLTHNMKAVTGQNLVVDSGQIL